MNSNCAALCNILSTAGLIVITEAEYKNMLLLLDKQNVEIEALEYRITTLLTGDK